MKKITCTLSFLILFVFQIEYLVPLSAETLVVSEAKDPSSSEAKETPASGKQGMSEREFFNAVQMPEYCDSIKSASQLYNENKYKESTELTKKVLDLYNERYEGIKEGYKKYGALKEVQKKFEREPILLYAMGVYADAAATGHGAHIMEERYFMILKAHKLFEYISAMYPTAAELKGYYLTTARLLSNAKGKSRFTIEEVKTYEDTVKPYDFTKEEMRTLKNAVELIDKVDKVAKEYKPPKVEAKLPEPAKESAGEKVTGLEEPAAEK